MKVSICIPAYNQTHLLEKCLNSIIEQEFKTFEVIVSDDSDTSAVEELVNRKKTLLSQPIVYVRNNPPLGSPANWNKAVSMATGDYIKIMHHDDWFAGPQSLGKFADKIKSASASFVFCSSRILNLVTNEYSVNSPDSDYLSAIKKNHLRLFDNNKIGSPSAVMFKKQNGIVFDEKLRYLVDVDFYMAYLSQYPDWQYIDEELIVNTSNSESQVTAASLNKATQIGEYCYLYNKWYKGRWPDKHFRHFFKHLFSWYNLQSLNELETWGYEKPRPQWLFNLILRSAQCLKQSNRQN